MLRWFLAFSLALAAADEAFPDARAREEDLSELQHLLTENWAYLEERQQHAGLDLDAVVKDALAENKTAHTPDDFRALLARLVAKLKDGHAAVGGSYVGFLAWPFSVREDLVVDHLDRAGAVQVGDVLISVDGVAAPDLLRTRFAEVAASTDSARAYRTAREIRFTNKRESTFVLERRGRRITVTVSAIDAHEALARGETVSWRIVSGNIGYIQIRSFLAGDLAAWMSAAPADRERIAEPELRAIREAFDAIRGTTGLVLDLRGNSGGTDLLGMEVARRLVPAGSVYYYLSSKATGSWSLPGPDLLPKATEEIYTRPLAVLIDEGSFSATDNLAACLQDNRPNTIFVGRPTGGGSGAPRPFRLPHTGISVVFSTMRVHRPNGGLIEGHGTVPEILVRWPRTAYETGKDPDREAAVEWLNRKRVTSRSRRSVD